MSVFDELKKEAAAQAARRKVKDAEELRTEVIFQAQARKTLEDVYAFFHEFKKTLEEVRLEINADYAIEGYGGLDGLRQGEYVLKPDTPRDLKSVTFSFICQGDRTVVFARNNRAKVTRQREYLWRNGLRFEFKPRLGFDSGKELSGDFYLEPIVPVSVTVESELEARKFVLILKNLEEIGENRYSLKPREVSQKLLEEIARAILRKRTRLNEMLGFSLSNTMRMVLKAKLVQEAKAKGRSLAESEPPRPDADRPRGLRGVLRGLLRRS